MTEVKDEVRADSNAMDEDERKLEGDVLTALEKDRKIFMNKCAEVWRRIEEEEATLGLVDSVADQLKKAQGSKRVGRKKVTLLLLLLKRKQ